MNLAAIRHYGMLPADYIIEMSYSIAQLQILVNARIKQGYIPHGAPQFAVMGVYDVENRQTYVYMQALVVPAVYKQTTTNGGTHNE